MVTASCHDQASLACPLFLCRTLRHEMVRRALGAGGGAPTILGRIHCSTVIRAPAVSLSRETETRWCFSTLRVEPTRGSRVGRVSVHAASMVGCLEEAGVNLGMGLRDLCEAGLKTRIQRILPYGHTCGQRESPGRKDGEAGQDPTALEPPPPLTVGHVLLGTEIMMTSMMMTPSTPRPDASPPTTPLGGSFTAFAATAVAWAARPACSPRPRPSPTPPSQSTCTAGEWVCGQHV